MLNKPNISICRINNKKRINRGVSLIIMTAYLLVNVFTLPVYSQSFTIQGLPAVGKMLHLSGVYRPAVISGIKIFPENPLRLDFIVDPSESGLAGVGLKEESNKLIKYFLAALTVPEKDLWVNLSPYESERIIPQAFGITKMGRDLLAQDYVLKQLSASLTHPDIFSDELGVMSDEEGVNSYSHHSSPITPNYDFLNKIWIVPEKAVVYENGDIAYVVESRLKVMTENEYLNPERRGGSRTAQTSGDSIRSIIPTIEHEVNTGKNFAQLRQIYNSLILATWYKRKLKNDIMKRHYVGQNKVDGVDIENKSDKQEIYNKYLEAFKAGAYNMIKDEYDPVTQQIIPRKYFSGGADLWDVPLRTTKQLSSNTPITNKAMLYSVRLDSSTKDFAMNNLDEERVRKKMDQLLMAMRIFAHEGPLNIINHIQGIFLFSRRHLEKISSDKSKVEQIFKLRKVWGGNFHQKRDDIEELRKKFYGC